MAVDRDEEVSLYKESEPKPLITRRRFLGGLGVVGAFVVADATVSPFDLLRFQKSRENVDERRRQEEEAIARGEEMYTEAFRASSPMLIKPGQKDVVIPNAVDLAVLQQLETHEAEHSDWTQAYNQYRGVIERELWRDYPTWGNPPHVNINDYDSAERPSFTVIKPGDSDLVGLPTQPSTPYGVLAVFDGSDEYAGDITITMGDDRLEITNHGLGEHAVHLLAIPAE